MIIETEKLLNRNFTLEDSGNLFEILASLPQPGRDFLY